MRETAIRRKPTTFVLPRSLLRRWGSKLRCHRLLSLYNIDTVHIIAVASCLSSLEALNRVCNFSTCITHLHMHTEPSIARALAARVTAGEYNEGCVLLVQRESRRCTTRRSGHVGPRADGFAVTAAASTDMCCTPNTRTDQPSSHARFSCQILPLQLPLPRPGRPAHLGKLT